MKGLVKMFSRNNHQITNHHRFIFILKCTNGEKQKTFQGSYLRLIWLPLKNGEMGLNLGGVWSENIHRDDI